jgi:hypothetical protein
MVQPLGASFDDAAPAMLMAERVEPQRIAALLHVEAELGVEVLGRLEVRNGEHELVERVNPDGCLVGGRRHIAAYGGHGVLLVDPLRSRSAAAGLLGQ